MSDDVQVEWPRHDFDTREQALADVLAQSQPGDAVVVHQDGCAVELGQCTCEPERMIVPGELS